MPKENEWGEGIRSKPNIQKELIASDLKHCLVLTSVPFRYVIQRPLKRHMITRGQNRISLIN